MDKTKQLQAVIDGIINGDDAAAKAAFAPYVQAKTREVLGYSEPVVEPVQEGMVKKLQEWIDMQAESPIRLSGDKVFVDGQQKGVIQNDPTDWDSGINFIEDGGQFSKEFDALETLYDFLIQRYTKGETV